MKRKIYTDFLRWKQEENGRVALLIEGARRIGKSYIVSEFAQNEYDTHLIINFSKASKKVHELFDLYLEDLDSLFLNLEAFYPKTKLLPRKSPDAPAKTLIVFDEVQFCPRAREAIKYLVEDHRFDYIETGSLISIKKNVKDILIPSEEQSIDMFPMDFEEFLWAIGAESLWTAICKNFAARRPMGDLLHHRASDAFRRYLIVGGMPQAVELFVNTNNFHATDTVKRNILKLYRNDIYHYADRNETKVAAIFDQLPGELAKHEKKYRLASLEEKASMRSYEDAFFWLSDARIVNCCYNATEPSLGLRLNENRTTLKCYMGDTGLLVSHAFDSSAIEKESLYAKLLSGNLAINEGMLIENIVAQMLRAAGHKLYFYSKASPDAEDRMEIDFLLPRHTLSRKHNISPVEVKSGRYTKLSSLRKCLAKYPEHLGTPYVLHDGDVKIEDGIVFLPHYMAPLLP